MEEKKKRGVRRVLISLLIIIIVILLLLRACSNQNPVQQEFPTGDYQITDTKKPGLSEQIGDKPLPDIAFALFLTYEVSAESPDIELRNPEENFVDFVFSLTDVTSGERIAHTSKVPAGKYVYVNVADFYTEPGVYDVALNIATYDAVSGEQMNGLNQTVEIVVKK